MGSASQRHGYRQRCCDRPTRDRPRRWDRAWGSCDRRRALRGAEPCRVRDRDDL